MSPVLKQDLSGLLDSLLVKPAGGHVMQEGNVSNNLLGVVILAVSAMVTGKPSWSSSDVEPMERRLPGCFRPM